jgi:hypothetical protein
MLLNSWGNGTRITSFIDHPLEINLEKPFTILAWLNSSDTRDWRTLLSIESSKCRTSLLNIALIPRGRSIYIAYMRTDQHRTDVTTQALAPGPSVWFHLALVLDSFGFTTYVHGAKSAFDRLEAP